MSKGKKKLYVRWKGRLKLALVHWCLLLLLHFVGTHGGSKESQGDPFMPIDIFIGFPIYLVVAMQQHGKQVNALPFFHCKLKIESKYSG